jgi:hypothetical protein
MALARASIDLHSLCRLLRKVPCLLRLHLPDPVEPILQRQPIERRDGQAGKNLYAVIK